MIDIFNFPGRMRGRYYRKIFERESGIISRLFSILEDEKSKLSLKYLLKAYVHPSFDPEELFCLAADGTPDIPIFKNRKGRQIHVNENMYFRSEFFDMNPEQVLLDGGAYTGDTLREFEKFAPESTKTAYSFEPDPVNYKQLEKCAEKLSYHAYLYSKGLDDHFGEERFGGSDSRTHIIQISEGKGRLLQVIEAGTFVEMLEKKNLPLPNMIKLDIEGREKEVILSLSSYIRKRHPDLMISIYHHPEDLWRIPMMLYSINSGYRLFIRHHSDFYTETVCYAVYGR